MNPPLLTAHFSRPLPFVSLKKDVILPLFPPPAPPTLLISGKSLLHQIFSGQIRCKKKYEEISVNVVNIACAHELIQPHVDYHANAVFTIFAADLIPPSCTFLHHICGEKVPP